MIKLPADVKKRWLTALRSGKYKQGYKQLCNGEAHCCLGVLYEVMGGTWTEENGKIYTKNVSRSYMQTSDVPEEVYDVLAQYVIDPSFPEDTIMVQRELGRINDKSTDYNRAIIWIENNL